MRAKLLGAALAALLAPVAFAGDITPKGRVAAPPAAHAQDVGHWSRTGLYVGLLGAYDTTVLEAEGIDLASGKLMAGALIGYNWRAAPGLVLGVEADWMLTGVSASAGDDEVSIRASTDHLVSVRARAGVPLGPTLLFVTAGPAWQHAKLTVSQGEDSTSDREWQQGAAFGGGAEVELSRALAVRLEALHYVFPEDEGPLRHLLDSENQHTIIRGGLTLKLN
jgi:opacity protein-like surface antigen